jgi:RHS repeat-associated protein
MYDCLHAGTTSAARFTGKERDSETGLDWFETRYLSSAQGRFTSADNPKFAEKTDPQSWNLYAYVGNNPLSRIDLSSII